MKYTPKPWKVVKSNIVREDLDGDTIIANILIPNDNIHEQHANGILIAASPDILEALELCYEVIDYVTVENMAEFIGVDRVVDACRAAKIAIKKAKGL
jgi:hypothetical protein